MAEDTPQKILIVDDNTNNLEVMKQILKDEYQLYFAKDGKKTLEIAQKQYPDLILLDVMMPEIDGFETCRELKSNKITENIPIIFVTALSECENEDKGFEYGAVDYITKPVNPSIVRARVKTHLSLVRKEELTIAIAEKIAAEEKAKLANALAKSNRELKETQVMLVQAAKMAALGQLTAGLAHEINNPLAFIRAHLETLEENSAFIKNDSHSTLSSLSRKKIEKILQRIPRMLLGVNRVNELITKLKTFSRLDEGEVKVIDINESIDSVITILEPKLKNIKLSLEYGEIPKIACYAGPLNQVFMNIIANAAEAIDTHKKNGKIKIQTEYSKDRVDVTISDNGCGISENIKERIFEPFYTTKDVGEGTGLGLSIAYNIIKKHNGEIEVESKTGEGTSFLVRIPNIVENGT